MKNRNLLIAPSGHDSVYRNWIGVHAENNYDIAILDYTPEGIVGMAGKIDYYQHKQGFKWHLIHDFITANPTVLDNYDYFFFPDDDIICNSGTINKLFDIFKQSKLELGQPSLTQNSFFSWRITKQKGTGIRYTSHVEVMCPIMTKDTLIKLITTFKENDSSWGIDLAWSELLNRRNIGIIDTVSVYHSKPVGGRSLYKYFKRSPQIDMQEMVIKYKCKEPFFVELK